MRNPSKPSPLGDGGCHAHHDYIAMSGGRKMEWLPDVGGVLHPQRVDVT